VCLEGPFKWEVPGGASTDPCDETYKGVKAGDSVENTALRAFINSKINTPAGVKMFIDFHSYSYDSLKTARNLNYIADQF